MPLRVAEDAAVLDLMSGERLELGIGPGGNASAFTAFGLDGAPAADLRREHADAEGRAGRPCRWPAATASIRPRQPAAWIACGRPPSPLWRAPPRRRGGRRAAALAHPAAPQGPAGPTLADIQNPMIDAYLRSAAARRAPRILASRSRLRDR
jgi:alkanesulfonate monooxygenase SsuD/methylene tetrahydromethanopterin reductase-like flavin-dependent oxidoreductase (luciferase family)